MADLTKLDDLKVLECALQDRLHAHMGRVVPFQVQCVFKEGVLWVLAQHSAAVVVDTQETFRVLEKALQAEQPGQQLPVKLYLRKQGDQRPYSTENFTVYPAVTERIPREAAPAIDETDFHEPTPPAPIVPEPIASQRPPSQPETPQPVAPEQPVAATVEPTPEVDRAKAILDRLALDAGITAAPPPLPPPSPDLSPAAEDTLTGGETIEQELFSPSGVSNSDLSRDDNAAAFANDIQSSFSYTEDHPPKKSRWPWLAAGGLGLLTLGVGGFGLSRPCVLGACPPLQTAQTLAEKSLATLNRPATGKEILDAQTDLRRSVAELKTVPMWSGKYSQAQANLAVYSRHATMVDIAVEGMKKAHAASAKISKQPVAQETWKESQKLWVEAIAELEKIPPDSRVYPLAQQKLQEYQQKLETVNKNITSEVNADKNLASAKAVAINNTAKQAQAKTLENWQAADREWQSFEKLLADIPTDTTAHATAQKLKQDYQAQVAAVRDRLTKEQANGEILAKAKVAADEARQLGKEKKWPEALARWNAAIATIQTVPQDSTYQAKSQAAFGEYSQAMKTIEQSIVKNQKQIQADASLKQICEAKPPVCTYQVEDKGITVKLLAEYVKTVQQTAADATKQDDNNAKVGLVRHVSSVGDALESVSNNSNLPLQLMGDDGKLIQKYLPRANNP